MSAIAVYIAPCRQAHLHILCCAVLAAGCRDVETSVSGGSDGPVKAREPALTTEAGIFDEGLYLGEITSNETQEVSDLTAFVDGGGFFRFMTSQSQFRDDFRGQFIGITAPGHTWPDGTTASEFRFELAPSASPRFDIHGTHSGGGVRGTWSLYPKERNLDIPKEGLWVSRDGLQNPDATFEIAADESIYGSNVDGCVFQGSLETSLFFWFVFDVSLTVENCPEVLGKNLNGEYAGRAALTDIEPRSDEGDLLLLGVDNDEQAIMLSLERL